MKAPVFPKGQGSAVPKEGQARIKASSPARVISVSFALVIALGTLLLMLPFSSRDGSVTPFLNALFTATSATCVTGLVVYDTFLHWSLFGQLVIIGLIQIGGLGLVTFTTFFNLVLGRKLGLRGLQLAQESINFSSFINLTKLVKMVVFLSLLIEVMGALLLSSTFIPKYGAADGAFISVFLSISAFCNAGFDILGREGAGVSLLHYNGDAVVLFTLSALIMIGGLGFGVWYDLLHYRKEKKLTLHTKIVLIVTVLLLLLGTLLFLLLEWSNPRTLGALPVTQRFNAAFFQSACTRTAGFASIDLGQMRGMTQLCYIFLMIIGAAPGSTGGGIKVTTFAVLVMTVVSVIRNKPDTEIMGRRVDKQAVYKAVTISCIGGLAVLVSSCMIYFGSEPGTFSGLEAVFESVSAFATVGSSVGVTAKADLASKLVLIFSMFLGRVGPVSFAFAFANNTPAKKGVVLPEGKIMVG